MNAISGAMQLRVRQITQEAHDVLLIKLIRPDGGELPTWTYGAHIDVVISPDLIRQYSLCSRPESTSEWAIAVLREPSSSGASKYLHDVLKEEMAVNVTGPRNNFPLVASSHYLLIAGGIGITPLLPMAQHLDETQANWQMFYGGRSRSSMAFLNQPTLRSDHVVIVPEDESGLLDIRSIISAAPMHTAIYCCGPEPLIASVQAQCKVAGRASPHVERFNSRPRCSSELASSSRGDAAFEVVLAGSGKHYLVPEDRTIIEVLCEDNVYVPTSCTEGYCGVCETEVISGTPDHRDDYLTPESKATNKTMMICVGRSKTPELVIDI